MWSVSLVILIAMFQKHASVYKISCCSLESIVAGRSTLNTTYIGSQHLKANNVALVW